MKKLLLLITVLGSFLSANAQGSCGAAVTLTANGTFTVAGVAGTLQPTCYAQTTSAAAPDNTTNPSSPMSGIWYKFTPASSGTVVVTSDLITNVAPLNVDTRVSVSTGTCAALTCLASNDDVSGTNFLSTVNFNVTGGVTYYIQWDDYWNNAGFNFTFTYTAVSCLPVTTINPATNISTTGVTLNWAAAAGAPAEYQVEYGSVGFVQGAGTTITVPTNSATISGLTVSTPYDFYVRSKCGAASFSTWTTINSFTTAKTCPQAFGFETTSELVGFTTFGNASYGLSANAPALAQAGNFYWIFNTNATTVSNNWLFTAPFSLQANEAVTVTFWIRSSTVRSLRFTVGNLNTSAAQTTQLWSNAAINNPSYVQYTATFTATTAGIYYFGWNDISTAQAQATMRLDTVSFSSTLSNNEFLASNISVYPNPTKNSITISNSLNALVESVVLTDLNGRIVKSQKINAAQGQVNISDLSTGIYMMNVSTDQGSVTKKIVKE